MTDLIKFRIYADSVLVGSSADPEEVTVEVEAKSWNLYGLRDQLVQTLPPEPDTALKVLDTKQAQRIHFLRVVLDVTGNPVFKGYAGDWARKVVELALKCDDSNLTKLGLAFPEAVYAVRWWRVAPIHAAIAAKQGWKREEEK